MLWKWLKNAPLTSYEIYNRSSNLEICKRCKSISYCSITKLHDLHNLSCPCAECMVKIICSDSCTEFEEFFKKYRYRKTPCRV